MIKRLCLIFLLISCFLPGLAQSYPDAVKFSSSLSGSTGATYITPNYRFVFNVSSSSSVLVVYDTLLFKEVATYSIGSTPYDMVIADDGLKAYLVSSKTDSITVLDISDPQDISESGVFSLGTSGVTFRKIEKAEVSGNLYLFVSDQAGSKIYVYDATAEVVVDSVSNPINLTFVPADIDVSPDETTISVLGNDGKFRVFSTATFADLSDVLDIGAYSASDNFIKVEHATVPSLGEVAFVLNSNSTGEVFMVSMITKLSERVRFVIDADPTGGTAQDPIVVGSGPADILLATVADPDSGDDSALYLYCSVPSASHLQLADMKDVGGTTKIEPFDTIASTGNVLTGGLVAGSSQDGYIYAADSDADQLKVISENPLVTLVSPTDDASIESGSLAVTFKAGSAGTYKMTHFTGNPQESISSTVGSTLKSGSHASGEEISHDVSVNELSEGENIIAFFATTSDKTGRKALKIIYDTVPSAPTGLNVEFGNQKLLVTFNRNSEEDMDHYNLYFGLASDTLDGADGIASPITVEHPDTGTKVSYNISPLTNGVEIFLQVSAVDQYGNESEKTDIVSNIPENTIGPLGLSGEKGCGMVFKGGKGIMLPIFLLLLLLALLILTQRSFTSLAIMLIFTFSMNVSAQDNKGTGLTDTIKDTKAPTEAITLTSDEGKVPERDLKDRYSTSFQISWFMPSNAILKQFYGWGGNENYSLKSTYFFWFIEAGAEIGFSWESARLIGDTTGRQSGERAKMIMMPFSFPVIFNLRINDHQMIVPYGKIAYNFVWYRIGEPTETVNGLANRLTLGGGFKFNFENMTGIGRSWDLGINHIFLLFEWIYSHHFKSGAGLSFSGNYWGLGLGVDY